MSKSSGDFSSLAVGCAAVARISTVSAQAALCAALGYFVDRRFETAPWGTVVGALIGAAAFGVGLVATAKRFERESASLSEETSRLREREDADLEAVISAESSKTEALRGEFEATLARAATFAAAKPVKPAKLDGENETERLQ